MVSIVSTNAHQEREKRGISKNVFVYSFKVLFIVIFHIALIIYILIGIAYYILVTLEWSVLLCVTLFLCST